MNIATGHLPKPHRVVLQSISVSILKITTVTSKAAIAPYVADIRGHEFRLALWLCTFYIPSHSTVTRRKMQLYDFEGSLAVSASIVTRPFICPFPSLDNWRRIKRITSTELRLFVHEWAYASIMLSHQR